jgi:RNA polymerase sigma factor (sigma-70 family)
MNPEKSQNIESKVTFKSIKPGANDFAEYDARTDVEIWQDFKKGSVGVLIYMYHQYVAQLLRFGIQFAPREVVKDSIQDLFLYLKERKKHTDDVKNISAYLYKSLYRIINKKVEYAMKWSSVDMNSEIKNWRIVFSKEITLIEQEHQQEQEIKLQHSLDSLSPKQRQAILLYYYEGFTHSEITEIMGLKNKSSVRKLIYRALDMLRDSFSV